MKKRNKKCVVVFSFIMFFGAGLAQAKKLRNTADADAAYVMIDGSQSRGTVAVFGKKIQYNAH